MRPRGIVLLATIYFLIASLMALGALAVLLGIRVPGEMEVSLPGIVVADPQEDLARGFRLHWVAAAIFFFFTVFFGGTALGLWHQKNWARWLAIGFSALCLFSLIPGAPFSVFVGSEDVPLAVWALLLALHGGILVYLFIPSVREAFSARKSPKAG